MREVSPHQRNDARIAGGFIILRERFQHDHIRPPMGVLFRTDRTIEPLMSDGPVHPLASLRHELFILEQIGQWDEAIKEIRPTLPAFARAAEPAAVGTYVGPEFVEM